MAINVIQKGIYKSAKCKVTSSLYRQAPTEESGSVLNVSIIKCLDYKSPHTSFIL